ncbi:protein toll-like [Chrysoperla carnea]|uniref:protein toll-like n=1 Tax=Chrysoperla carnea TaxID=189513 RepID=UPI001D0733FE|nr:protein toll-like [Chrysoperla carnea]
MYKQISIFLIVVTFFVQNMAGVCIQGHVEYGKFSYTCGQLDTMNNLLLPIKLTADEIDATESNKLRLDCHEHNKINDYQDFKTINKFSVQNLTTLHIVYCPVNANFTFTNFLNIFNVSTVSKIFYESTKATNVTLINGDFFESMENLTELTIKVTSDTYIHSDLLKNLKNLRVLIVHDGHIKFTTNFFENTPHLQVIEFSSSNGQYLPQNLFENLHNLINLQLFKNNHIEYLPDLLFRDAKNLLKLNLSGNRIRNISENLFKSLGKLEGLDLSGNQISSISDIFVNQKNLKILYITHNSLTTLKSDVFKRLTHLETLALEYNQLSFEYSNPFNHVRDLRVLDLSHNNITSILHTWKIVLTKLTKLNLAYNQIKSVGFRDIFFGRQSHSTKLDLSNNLIEVIDFSESDIESKSLYIDEIEISNNPINCNCKIHNLVRYFKKDEKIAEVHNVFKLIASDLKCAGPKKFQDHDVRELEVKDLSCPISSKDNCPQKCNCHVTKFDHSTIVNCSNSNLTRIPSKLPQNNFYPNIKLYLDNNNLGSFDINETFANHSGYQNVRELYIQNNRLSEITWLPNQLRVIKLHSNRLEQINITILQNLPNLTNLTLHQNPWMCECNDFTTNLKNYIQENYTIFEKKHLTQILCDTTPFTAINDLCARQKLWITMAISILTATATTALLIVVFYKYEIAIRVWCYKHKVLLWWVYEKENDNDKNKKYDAFVCHAHQDEDFVTQQLIPNLEECESPFKLCVHSRDWLAGRTIPDQIARTILESRRVLVLLSPHLLESSWALQEFRVAHKNALDERRSRVIVIKLAEVDEKKLDPELKDYLKLNTYIEWGHSRFWDNLRYALPHQKPLSRREEILSQQITQALLKDTTNDSNQFELPTTQPISVNQQTSGIPQVTARDNTKDPLMHDLLDNLQIVQNKNSNRNIA